MFSHRTELFLEDKLMPLQWQKSCWKRLFPLAELLSNSTVTEEQVSQVLQQVCAIWLVVQHFHCAYHTQSSGLVECIDAIIKIQLAKFVETLQIPWPNALLLVLLKLRSTPFGVHKLSPSEVITGCPMHLTPAGLDLKLIKGDIFQYH